MARSLKDQFAVKKVNLYQQPSDFAYWQSQSYLERLEALEQIRQEFLRWRYGAEPGFQIDYAIVKRKKN